MDNELLAQRYERIRRNVIRQANQLFRAQGIRDVTMDDISKCLRISKRTLYQLFNGKEGLVLACVKQDVANDGARRAEIERHTDDALEILFRVAEFKLNDLQGINPNYPRELRTFPSVVAFQKQRVSQQPAHLSANWLRTRHDSSRLAFRTSHQWADFHRRRRRALRCLLRLHHPRFHFQRPPRLHSRMRH